jgi:putative acetyltransferase
MKVRRGIPGDVPRLLAIWRSAVDATHHFLSAEDRSAIDLIVADQYLPTAELWVATDDKDRPMGFLDLDGARIEALFVGAEVHGRGYGSLLVDHALSLEPKLSVDANEQADNAVKFYMSRGFRVVGRSPMDDDGRPYPLVHLAR